jgi:cobalt-zinc-cadmium efflux system outer membrane protein
MSAWACWMLRGALSTGLAAQLSSTAPSSSSPGVSMPSPAPAASTAIEGTLTLDEVWRRAQTHPLLVAADADIEVGEGQVLAAEGAFDPALKAGAGGDVGNYAGIDADVGAQALLPWWGARVDGGWRLGLGDRPIYAGKEKTSDYGELNLGLRVPLLRDLLIDERRAGVERQILEAARRRAAALAARLDLQRTTAAAYFDWVAAGARLDVANNLLQLAETRDQQLRRRAEAGDVPAIEGADNTRLIAQRRQRLIASERALQRAALTLALAVRDDDGRPVTPGPQSLPAVTALAVRGEVPRERAGLIELAVAQRPELVGLRQAVAQSLVDERLAGNQLLPGLSVGATVSQDMGPTHEPWSDSSSVWNPDPKARSLPDASVDLRFDVPIPQRAARGRAAVADANVRKARALAQLLEERITLEVDDAMQANDAAVQRVAAAVVELEAAEAVLLGERQRFDAGDSTLVVVNLREVALAEAQLAVVEARVDVARAEVGLRLVTGGN